MKSINMRNSKKAAGALILIFIGVIYAGFVSVTGYGVPCIFKLVTGFDCPGCGITRMLVSLLQGDIYAAYQYNPVLFCLSPYILFRVFTSSRRGKILTVMDICCVVILLVWGIIRNIV